MLMHNAIVKDSPFSPSHSQPFPGARIGTRSNGGSVGTLHFEYEGFLFGKKESKGSKSSVDTSFLDITQKPRSWSGTADIQMSRVAHRV
jgi:hypothetical protein